MLKQGINVIVRYDETLAAVKEHLADMRKIVFEALAPPELPPQLPKR